MIILLIGCGSPPVGGLNQIHFGRIEAVGLCSGEGEIALKKRDAVDI
jgi:hypothetical protein